MESKVMGKTLAILMVIAMISTGIAMLPNNVQAGAYLIKGQVLDKDTDKAISGVNVFITVNSIPMVYANATTGADGKFSKYVDITANYSFDIEFTKTGFNDETKNYLGSLFNGTVADTGVTLLTPQNQVKGIVRELGTTTPVSDVKVTFEETVLTDIQGTFSFFTGETKIDIDFSKNGYYTTSKQDVDVDTITDIGIIYIEKIVPTPTIQVWGYVFNQERTQTIPNATVSISEGDDKWISAFTNRQGYYEMLAYPGNFQVKASHEDYFTTMDTEWWLIPENKMRDIELEIIPTVNQTLNGTVTSKTGAVIANADVYLHSTDGKFSSFVNLTHTDGTFNFSFYKPLTGSFVLEIRKDGYYANVSNTDIKGTGWRNVQLDPNNQNKTLRGVIYDNLDEKPLEGASVTIYSKNYTYSATTETDAEGYYEFPVNGSAWFMMVVNAEGYQSKINNLGKVIINPSEFVKVGLTPSGSDIITTKYTFDGWNTIRVTKNSVITVDNVTTRFNADRKFGMGPVGLIPNDGILSSDEIQKWANYLENKSIEQRDTEDFFTLNNTYYKLDTKNYSVSIACASGPISTNATIYINSTYNYTIASALENVDSTIFTLVLNATYDTEFVDYTNDIILPMTPKMFEMTKNVTETNNVEVMGYNNPITINPEIFTGDLEKVTMTIQRSNNGTAKAKILSGVHYVLNSTYDHYEVIVPKSPITGVDTNITFSADDSTDKIGDINKANFTWDFGDNTKGYGMEVKHNFNSTDGKLVVRLVINETGGNTTYQNITVFVDSANPIAGISAITTDSDNISYAPNVLTVNEDLPVVFSGIKFTDAYGMTSETIVGDNSTDLIKSGGDKGLIEKWYWSWGEDDVSDETITKDGSNNITHAYTKPGTYILNMIATDVVNRESSNATWTVNVLDTTAPVTDFNIKNADKTIVTEVIEKETFQYNASITIDNFDDIVNLTFKWFFDNDGTIETFTGMSVDYPFTKVGDFNVTLMATDIAGNYLNKTTLVHVNLAERPNILMKLGSMVFGSKTGTAGKAMTISVNITNDGKEDATNIQTKFYIRNADGTDKEIGTATTAFIGIGNTSTATISWTPGKKGEFSIWANSTCAEEHSSQWWDNKIDDFSIQKVTVKEAAWVMPAIIIGIVVVIIVVFLGMRYFMKSGTEKEATGEKRKKK